MTNALQPDALKQHFRQVDTVAAIAPPPTQWSELRRRWLAFSDLGTPMRNQLVTAVIDGGGDVPTLAALAAGEASELGQRAAVANTVRKAVLARLIEIYSKVAAANYGKVAAAFDGVAANFTAAAGKCDPELDGAAIVGPAWAGPLKTIPVVARAWPCWGSSAPGWY